MTYPTNRRCKAVGLNKPLGGSSCDSFERGLAKLGTIFTRFWLPSTGEALSALLEFGHMDVFWQDRVCVTLQHLDFANMHLLRGQSIPQGDVALLGARELGVLLTDFLDTRNSSILEDIRSRESITEIVFPGTKFVCLNRLNHQVFFCLTANYKPDSKKWEVGTIIIGCDGLPDEKCHETSFAYISTPKIKETS